MKKFAFLSALLLLASLELCSQEQVEAALAIEGKPRIVHFTRKDFQSDPQFWCMTQDHNGFLYYGNNEGTLIFDGERWDRVRLPNNSSVRSLKVGLDGTIYAGGFNEFGIIERDEFGVFSYQSKTHLLRAEDRSFENIWQIHEAQGFMVFRSTKMLIVLADGKALTLPTGVYNFSAVVNNRLFVQDDAFLNVIDLTSMDVRSVVDLKEFGEEQLLALLPGQSASEIFAITKQGSFYELNLEKKKLIFKDRILPKGSNNLLTCAIRGTDGRFYIGTLRSKVISISDTGRRIETDAAFNAIQDHTVLNLFESSEGNIWVLLNNGIDCIDLSSPLTLLCEDASVYDVKIVRSSMYVATNQGVLSAAVPEAGSLSNEAFISINGLEGQAWSLQYLEGRLICSHDRGLFEITENGSRQIPGATGIWKVIPVRDKPHHYLACTYSGMYVIKFDEYAGFRVSHKVEGFEESSRDILQADEPGTFWICHGYKGVFRIKMDESLSRVVTMEHFKDENGLPSPFNINVSRWQSDIVFTTNQGIFTYDTGRNQFKPHTALNTIFGTEKNVRQLRQVRDRTWFVHDNEVGYFYTDHKVPDLHKGEFLQLKGTFNSSMECIEPIDEKTALLGTNNGLYAFDLAYAPSAALASTQFSSVIFRIGGIEKGAELKNDAGVVKFPHDLNSLSFSFSAPGFQDKFNIEYSYWLEGAEPEWSPWNGGAEKEYALLPPGHYAFHVKAQSLLGERAGEAVYHFQVMPPWYSSRWAIGFYILSGTALIVLLGMLMRRRTIRENEKKLDEEKKKRKVLELELQRIRLQQEKEAIKKDKDLLEEDVIFKSKELANYTMLLVKKRDLLNLMHDELKELKDSVRNEAGRLKIRELIKRINSNLQDEEHLKVFEANFERVHHDFFTQLKSTYPDLTPKEQQLCAFVKMNLTNKEIASILNISVRGVETARYRLRKRLGMNQDEDMAQFLERLYLPTSEESIS